MDMHNVVIATMTWARQPEEEACLRTSLESLAKLGLPVYVTDGGSGENFMQFLKSLPNIHLCDPVKGLWNQTLSSLTKAFESGRNFIFYSEPDKKQFFESGLETMIGHIKADEQTGIVVAARSAAGFETFPPFQQITETAINNCCKEILGLDTDFVYGPFMMHRQLVPYLQTLPPSIGWGWRPYAFRQAQKSGLKISSYTGDFRCPEDQQTETPGERTYRIRQMHQNLEGLLLA